MRYGTRVDLNTFISNSSEIQKEYSELIQQIKLEQFAASDLGLKPRWVIHWEEKELFLKQTPKGKWHSFNTIEAFWIKILLKLRNYKFPLDSIKEVKNNLVLKYNDFNKEAQDTVLDVVKNIGKQKGEVDIIAQLSKETFEQLLNQFEINLLEIVIVDMVIFRNDWRLLINEKGLIILVKENFDDLYAGMEDVSLFLQGSYLSISLKEILRELIEDIDLNTSVNIRLLSYEEAEVINTIRQENILSVEVLMKKGNKPFQINTKKEIKIDSAARITDLINSGEYKEITLKIENGNLVYCKNIEKKRIK